jgi:hypothetical protein
MNSLNQKLIAIILGLSFTFNSYSQADCIDVAVRDSPVKVACSAPLDPVCGCDGITYENECKAKNAGVRKLAKGPCKKNPGNGLDCIDVAVRDSPLKLACSAPLDPVCGCDGITYENECKAKNAGVTRTTRGPCSSKNGTGVIAPDDCKSTVLVQCPPEVAEKFEPVCGCDGKTYRNSCVASNSVSRFVNGECNKQNGQGWNNQNSNKPKDGGWNGGGKPKTSAGNDGKVANADSPTISIDRSLTGSAAIWDHLKNWKGSNGENAAAKIDLTWYPDDASKGVTVVQNIKGKKEEGLNVQLDSSGFSTRGTFVRPFQVDGSNITPDLNIIFPVKNISPSADSTGFVIEQNLKDKVIVLNADSYLMTIRNAKGGNASFVQLEKPNSKGEIWGRCIMNKKKYLVKLNWVRGEVSTRSVFNVVK